jgi:hypothetical protein
MGSPHSYARAQRQIRALVKKEEGFPDAEVLLTEWNMTGAACESTGCRPYVTGVYNASHLVGAIAHLEDTDLPFAFRYRTDGPQAFGLFGDGNVEPEWGRTGLAFLVLRKLYETPVRLAATGGDGSGITVLAGRNPSGSQVRVAVASQASPSNSDACAFKEPRSGFLIPFTKSLTATSVNPETAPWSECAKGTRGIGSTVPWKHRGRLQLSPWSRSM